MHDLWTLVKVTNRFFILPSVNIHDTPVKIVILLIEDVFFVVVGFFGFFCIGLVIAFVCSLWCCRTSFQLSIELYNLIRVQVTNVLKLILFILILGLLYAETKIISFRLALFEGSILFFATANSPNLVNFGTLCTRNHLWMLVLNWGIVHDLWEVLIILLSD